MIRGDAAASMLRSRGSVVGPIDRALNEQSAAWRQGIRPEPGRVLLPGPETPGSPSVLAALVKADLRRRFEQGERPEVAPYLERYPELRESPDRVLSLIYEEFCLLEERGESPDSAAFCDRYDPWRNSLASQLRYHRLLSRAIGVVPARPRFPEVGELFGDDDKFILDEMIGEGGMARVYRAREVAMGHREVVLKVTAARGVEPSILGRLAHDNIVPVLSSVKDSGRGLHGLCMPYLRGITLDKVIARVAPPTVKSRSARDFRSALADPATSVATVPGPPRPSPGWSGSPERGHYADASAWVMLKLARALSHAHGEGFYHRDVKPANVLLTLVGGPMLLDFNLAAGSDVVEAGEAHRGGTLPYMAPEHLAAFLDGAKWAEVKAPADIYSLGLVMTEMLTGRPPDVPEDLTSQSIPRSIQALRDHRMEPRPSLRSVDPTIPHSIEAIVERCLAPNPSDRYPDAASLAEDLQRHLDRRPLLHAPNRSTRERAGNFARRHRRWFVALAFGAGCLTASAAVSPIAIMIAGVEHHPNFRKAVALIDEKKFDLARLSLESLNRDFPRDPLVEFHLAAATAAFDTDRAAALVGAAFAEPDAEEIFIARQKHDPRLARRHGNLAGKLFAGKALGKAPIARKLFERALRLDPSLVELYERLAIVAERTGDHDAADGYYERAIGVKLKEPSSDSAEIKKFVHNRARHAISRGEVLLYSSQLVEAKVWFDRVVETLDRDINRYDSDDFIGNYLRARVALDIGDWLTLRERSVEARECYGKARQLAEKAQTQESGKVNFAKELLEHLKIREAPLPEGQRSNAPIPQLSTLLLPS